MKAPETIRFGGADILVYACNTVVVGTGAAGYSAALRLAQLGQPDVAIVTEGVNMGTSRNTGSDKQTYYKLSLSGDSPDSPVDMARDLFAGGCMDGDTALVEAALSARAFLHLCELGVDFPTNRYGEYIGYKTDHDPRARATSIGPLTSKRMTECLQAAVAGQGIPVYDALQVISILRAGDRVCGLLALNKAALDDEGARLVLFSARNIIYAVGGPAGVYAGSVYPHGHSGASGIAFEAGVEGQNLTEWQYGLASVAPRWNVSGTYMQALPRFLSVDADGTEYPFLETAYQDTGACLSAIFRKGYEWPFDSRKALDGSSVVDLLVYRETALLGRKVYLDYTQNPFGTPPDLTRMDAEARDYLQRAQAHQETPVERLLHMNAPAYALYKDRRVDLRTQRLQIDLCAQHCNGGLAVDMWWQTSLPGFFAVGEVAGTHGVHRPGGSALNAGQVGALRAAQYIAIHGQGDPLTAAALAETAAPALEMHLRLCESLTGRKEPNVSYLLDKHTRTMSQCAAAIRDAGQMQGALAQVEETLGAFGQTVCAAPAQLPEAYRLRDILLAQRVILASMLDYAARGPSRGSAIYPTPTGNAPTRLDGLFRFETGDAPLQGEVQTCAMVSNHVACRWRPVRPIPREDAAFETTWRAYRDNRNVF